MAPAMVQKEDRTVSTSCDEGENRDTSQRYKSHITTRPLHDVAPTECVCGEVTSQITTAPQSLKSSRPPNREKRKIKDT
ncbi:hypothetical protein N7478_000869 [Penicillium angulare]|uniref:uncharacterized protein n=1 Tax=Penicillium angulare TaxID=116970 RepID=UPI002541BC35|nr:uncharacterized protein N7478_000869 [Penicillium angulare]KAJ5291618.1 hypothetical protein N7478_000869 [Penicillium angulare]